MTSQQEEKTNEAKAGEPCSKNHEDSMPSATLTAYDKYTALRNHRIRFEDALDPNAERVTTLRKHDVIFGRGKSMQDYPGNKRMRTIINKYRKQYHEIQRSEKRDLIESVYKEIIQEGARFLTKSTNDEHFVVVDIEVAIQKVGNTLRCRKAWSKLIGPENDSVKKVPASLESTSSEVPPNRPTDMATSPAAINQNQSLASLSQVPPLMLRNRSHTMLLLRANTMRLMKQMPLLPATLDDVCYLQSCRSLQQSLGQLSSTNAQKIQVNSVVSGSPPAGLPKMAPIDSTSSSTK